MDHRGPEHHYDEVECPECGTFWQQGEIQPETVRNNCPECGYDLRSSTGGRPYRGQPSPINSEMTERNTPLDGASSDRGGNPLGEGILAGLKDKIDWEEIAELDEATEPAGLGETHPVKDNQWKPGDKGSPMGRDEILGSVRSSGEHSWSDPGDNDNQDLWDQVVEDFENAQTEPNQSTNKVATAPWLDEEPDNFPVEQLGWDIVDVVEPSKELTEAANKYSMPMPEGITDNLHEALIAVNAWVENPEENGKLRPYNQYWSVIRPKITQGSVQIGVEDPHMADIINDVARTNNLSALDKTSSINKQSWGLVLRALPMILGEGAEMGSIGGIMKGALNAGRAIQGINGLAQGAEDLLGDTGGGPDYNMIGQNTAPKMATYGDEYEHPSSITKRIEDPENIDPHQRSDESNDDWAYDMLDVNEIGSTHDPRGKDDAKERIRRQFAASESDSEAIKQFTDFLPLIMEFFHSEESGLEDPIIKSIHEGLESDFPGYLDLAVPDDENQILIMFDDKNKKESNTGPACFKCGMPADGPGGLCENHAAETDETATAKQGPAASTHSVQALSDTWSPQNPQEQVQNQMNKTLKQLGITASNTQGPHTDEQQNAFIEHIHEMLEAGQLDEQQVAQLEDMMFNEPSNPEVTKIWAEIANQDELFDAAPEDMAPSPQEQMQGMGAPGAPAPPGGDMGMGGPPGPGGPAPGIPDMNAPTPADLNPAGPGAMPPPIMSHVRNDMLKSILKHAADSAASTCPKCDGHTTGVVNQSSGGCECRSCGHKWDDKNLIPSDGTSTDTSTTASFYQALNLDEGPMEVMPGSVDSFSEPEELEEDDSTHTWADDSGEPLQEGKEYEIYAHNYEIPDVGRVVEVKPDSVVYEIESNGGLRTTIEIDRKEADLNGYRFVSTDFGSEDNPAGIEENLDTKNVTAPGQDSDLSTPHIQIGSSTKKATVGFWACPETPACQFNIEGGDFEPGECPYHHVPTVEAGENYMQQIYTVKEYQEGRNVSSLKTAGQHYTPMQQRELIDEYGEARNADKLNLEGTHYADSDPDYFLFGC